jgi:hypothetical protein
MQSSKEAKQHKDRSEYYKEFIEDPYNIRFDPYAA